MRIYIPYIAVGVAVMLATTAIILLTPLRYTDWIEPSISDIDAATFNAEFTANPGKFVFIDVRPEGPYAAVHAVGSQNMPLHTLYDTRHTLPKKGKTIVLICSGGRASGVGYSYLQHYGFTNIHRIEGGIERWISAGLPVEGTAVQILPAEAHINEKATVINVGDANILCA